MASRDKHTCDTADDIMTYVNVEIPETDNPVRLHMMIILREIITCNGVACCDNHIGLHTMRPLQGVTITWLREIITYNGMACRDNHIGLHTMRPLQGVTITWLRKIITYNGMAA